MIAVAYFLTLAICFGVALDPSARLPLRWVAWLGCLACTAGLVCEVAG